MDFNEAIINLFNGKWVSNNLFNEGNKVRWELDDGSLNVIDENGKNINDEWYELENKVIDGDFELDMDWYAYDEAV